MIPHVEDDLIDQALEIKPTKVFIMIIDESIAL